MKVIYEFDDLRKQLQENPPRRDNRMSVVDGYRVRALLMAHSILVGKMQWIADHSNDPHIVMAAREAAINEGVMKV